MFRKCTAVLAALLLTTACETDGTGPTIGDVFGVIGGAQGTAGQGGLTSFEIESGLREALIVGTDRVVGQLGRTDGFFGDPQIRIPLPGQLGDIQSQLQPLGLSGPLDDLQLRMNRAAEDAVPAARDLVVNAVRSITLEDAMGILQGGDSAATDFLRRKTEDQLRSAFTPYLRSSLNEVGAFAALDQATAQYGVGGIGTSLRDNLVDHGVKLGLDGVFSYLATEEKAIRDDPVKRTSEILRKVFGSVG